MAFRKPTFGPEHEGKELERLEQDRTRQKYWKKWGPYLSERQWATVREDYSEDGDAWSAFPHEHARSRVFRWGEDGIGGFSDTHQYMCTSFAFWNEKDPILKERLFGVTGHQGNHGEDVKEVYFYLDSTPTHSYMKYLYKYPQAEYPYKKLAEESQNRSREVREFEILDTDVFDEDRYWDIIIEYAKEDELDGETLIRVWATNRGPEPASLHIIPQTVFRNTWSWGGPHAEEHLKPRMKLDSRGPILRAKHFAFPRRRYVQYTSSPHPTSEEEEINPTMLFTENETNFAKLWGGTNGSQYVKDAFHERIVEGRTDAVNPEGYGTKGAAWYNFQNVPPGGSAVVRFKLTSKIRHEGVVDEEEFDDVIAQRKAETDAFYHHISNLPISEDMRNIQRQAFAGMLWSKQYYHFIYKRWIEGDEKGPPPPPGRKGIRNRGWDHMYVDDILSMPDKWEYPFFAAWDTAFHCIPLAMIDPEFAKKQLDVLTREWYLHPNGQIPAYEWNFSDVNPPVHAWAVWRTYNIERKMHGRQDTEFLERVFQKLLLNFTWWVNRKDADGNNVFEGGFLGLDNIGVFNRSEPLPTGGRLEQADATAWMAFYCLQMLQIALELARYRRTYEDIASKFLEHFLFIADALSFDSKTGDRISLWHKDDGFYYDAINWGGPWKEALPIKSLVGLIPLFAVLVIEPETLEKFPGFKRRFEWFLSERKGLSKRIIGSTGTSATSTNPPSVPSISANGSLSPQGVDSSSGVDSSASKSLSSSLEVAPEQNTEREIATENLRREHPRHRRLFALVDEERLRKILTHMLSETQFLSDHGIRSLSKEHSPSPEGRPFSYIVNGQEFKVEYWPADSKSGMFGGNSNWRGPIWLAVNFLLIESLQRFWMYYRNDFQIECPTGSGNEMSLLGVARELQHRLMHIFLRDEKGERAYNHLYEKMDHDPHFRDHVLFYEYFDGDTGRGIGASHQTGWTGLIAKIIQDTGAECRLPGTPYEPSEAAEHYFDEAVSPKRPKHHRRLSSFRTPPSVTFTDLDNAFGREFADETQAAQADDEFESRIL